MTDKSDGFKLANCAGKKQLSAPIAKSIALRHRKKGRKSDAYKCKFCRHWHVGNENPIRGTEK
jgi:hypothetical protein